MTGTSTSTPIAVSFLYRQVLPLDVTELMQSAVKRLESSRRMRRGPGQQHTKPRHLVRSPDPLLRACRKRPRRGGAAEQRDQLAASAHSITSSARIKSDVGMVRPRALAVLRLMVNR